MKMKKILFAAVFGVFTALVAHAQTSVPSSPHFIGAMNKLFGNNQTFSAALEWQTVDPRDNTSITIPGKITVDSGKSRFEVDMTQIKPSKFSPTEAAQMKQVGMEKVVMIDRPDKKVLYVVYDALQSCIEMPAQNVETLTSLDDYKIQMTELGKETLDGHPCIKNQVVVIDKQSNTNQFITWNATDLKNFPVKLQTVESKPTTMSFKNVSFDKPSAAQFDPPSGYTKYDSMMAMMRGQIMKQMGGAFGH